MPRDERTAGVRVINADRKSVRYHPTRDDDAGSREKLRDLTNQNRRFDYRPLHILLRRVGIMINSKGSTRKWEAATQPQGCCRHETTCSGARLEESTQEPRFRARPDGVGQAVPPAQRGR